LPELRYTTTLPGVTAQALWDWHAAPGALPRLVPGWSGLSVVRPPPSLADGTETLLRVKVGPFSWAWTARHRACEPGHGFIDDAVRGPFAAWSHSHRFTDSPAGAVLDDTLRYELPLGALGSLVAGRFVRSELDRTFAWRHARTRDELSRHQGVAPRTIAVSGASGLVGSALCDLLTTRGHRVLRLVRRAAGPGEISWDPARGELNPEDFVGVAAVVHLAGESIAQRWTPAARERILSSRVAGTSLIADALARCSKPPAVFVSASAIGLYGPEPVEADEHSPQGRGLLAEVCARWEAAAEPARAAGLRVVHPRIGIVQSASGASLAAQLLPFRLGLGGPLGAGTQGVSWISLDDLLDVLYLAIYDERLSGPVNAVAPAPVSQADYASALGAALSRPAVLPVPAFALRALLGEMADEVLLGGAFVRPRRLEQLGFTWRHPTLQAALAFELGALPPGVDHGA
jgi:uncharacterized protein (TIGR01777 family)